MEILAVLQATSRYQTKNVELDRKGFQFGVILREPHVFCQSNLAGGE